MAKTKVFWTPQEESRVFEQIQQLENSGRALIPVQRNFEHAQISVLDKSRWRSWSSSGSASAGMKRYRLWLEGGVKALERPARTKHTKHTARTAEAPAPVLTADPSGPKYSAAEMRSRALVDQYVAGTLPGSPAEAARLEARKELMGTITIDGLLSELVARAAVQALVPMTADLRSSLVEVLVYQKSEIAQMLADHKSVIEGMLEDNYVRLTNFWNSPVVNESKQTSPVEVTQPQAPVADPIIVSPVGQLKDQVQSVLEKVAAQLPAKPTKPRVYVAGAKPWVKQLSERMQHVDIICGDDKNPRNIGTFDLVITTRFIDHSAAGNLKHNHANYVHVPKGGITRVEATINNWLRMNRKA